MVCVRTPPPSPRRAARDASVRRSNGHDTPDVRDHRLMMMALSRELSCLAASRTRVARPPPLKMPSEETARSDALPLRLFTTACDIYVDTPLRARYEASESEEEEGEASSDDEYDSDDEESPAPRRVALGSIGNLYDWTQ